MLVGVLTHALVCASDIPQTSLQADGSFVIYKSSGEVADLVKQGTPRQSVTLGGQSCNLSYGLNSAGKKTILLSVPGSAVSPVILDLGENRITIPPKSALRITLETDNQVEKIDGNPKDTVRIEKVSTMPREKTLSPSPPAPSPQTATEFTPRTPASLPLASSEDSSSLLSPTAPPTSPPTQSSPLPDSPAAVVSPEGAPIKVPPPSPAPASTLGTATEDSSSTLGWPGKLLETPLLPSQTEEDQFYARTEFGPRFMSSMSLVSVTGPTGAPSLYNQKQIAFSTGYRQDLDVGVWLTDWFGLALETGFALNAVRGNTQGMTVSSSTFWTVPLLAQLCFQYPNDTGWIPYLNFGFGGGWTIFKVGGIDYTTGGQSAPSLSGTGNSVNNAYQIAAGVRYRLYEELSITMAYKFYGNSQANMNLDNGVQVTLGSPVTQSAEVGLNFSF